MRLLPLLLLPLAASCASPQQRAEETASYINANYGPLCEKLGYAPGSDAYRNCMLSMFNTDQMQMTPWYGPWGGWPRRR